MVSIEAIETAINEPSHEPYPAIFGLGKAWLALATGQECFEFGTYIEAILQDIGEGGTCERLDAVLYVLSIACKNPHWTQLQKIQFVTFVCARFSREINCVFEQHSSDN